MNASVRLRAEGYLAEDDRCGTRVEAADCSRLRLRPCGCVDCSAGSVQFVPYFCVRMVRANADRVQRVHVQHGEPIVEPIIHVIGGVCVCVCVCLLLQDLVQSCLHGGVFITAVPIQRAGVCVYYCRT
jgi:hypothetical protein